LREHGVDASRLEQIWQKIESHHGSEWLLPLEVFELACDSRLGDAWMQRILRHLETLKTGDPRTRALIENGLDLTGR
jgi:phenylalanine-4-hydroxylase